jgi:hypothetical protein
METHCVFYKVRTDSVAYTNAYSLNAKPLRTAFGLTNEIQNLTLMLLFV